MHNFFTALVVVSYFLGNHPRLPHFRSIFKSVKYVPQLYTVYYWIRYQQSFNICYKYIIFFSGKGGKERNHYWFSLFSLFYCRKTCSRDKKDEDDDDKKNKHESKLDAKFFSFTTFYYLVNQKIKEKTKPTTFFFPTLRHLYCFFSFVVSC